MGVIRPKLPSGVLFTVDDLKESILADAVSPAFDSRGEAQSFAEELIRSSPEGIYTIVKGLIAVQSVMDEEYWVQKSKRDEIRYAIIFFIIGVTISALVLFLETPTRWASISLTICMALSAAFAIVARDSPTPLMQVFLPIIVAICSTVVHDTLQ